MKKILFVLLVVLISTNLFAQTQSQPKYVYCEIIGTNKFMSRNVTIEIDFGQKMKGFADNRLRDIQTGKKKIFNSMIDALNHMGKRGWELVQAYNVTLDNQYTFHYLMKKPFNEFDKEVQLEFLKDD